MLARDWCRNGLLVESLIGQKLGRFQWGWQSQTQPVGVSPAFFLLKRGRLGSRLMRLQVRGLELLVTARQGHSGYAQRHSYLQPGCGLRARRFCERRTVKNIPSGTERLVSFPKTTRGPSSKLHLFGTETRMHAKGSQKSLALLSLTEEEEKTWRKGVGRERERRLDKPAMPVSGT